MQKVLRTKFPRLQYLSDVHLEKRSHFPKIKKCGEYLALLGDIGNPFSKIYRDFLLYSSQNWEKVFLVSGNHECYFGKTVEKTDEQIRKVSKEFYNIQFLQRESVEIDDYLVCGLTLFPSFENHPSKQHKDFGKYFSVDEAWLKKIVASPKKKIFLSHYLPSKELIVEPYRSLYSPVDQERWATSRENIFDSKVKIWLCGHSHIRIKKFISGVQCGINASLQKDFVDPP